MKSYILYFFLICFMSCHRTEKPVNLIFDTDMAPDYDDVGALALLHALAEMCIRDRGWIFVLIVKNMGLVFLLIIQLKVVC